MDEAAFRQRIREIMDRMRELPGEASARRPGRYGLASGDELAHCREAMQRFNIILDLAMLRR